VLRQHPILPFVVGVAIMALLVVSLVSFWRLCNKLFQIDDWRSRFEKSASWFTINDLTIFEWQVWWALMAGRLGSSEHLDIRRRARLIRRCVFAALALILALAMMFELEAPVSFLSLLFS
jgi:hypothetical protein